MKPTIKLKCLLQTAHNACNSKDVDALKFQLIRHDTLHNGQNQEDSTECLLMLIYIIHTGAMPDSSSTTSTTGASLSDILVSFVLEKYIVWDVCGLKACNINCKNPVVDAIRTLGTSNPAIYCKLQNICFSLLIDLDTLIIMSPK